ncbi:MAG: translation initiation factor IF-2 [Clostridia bacterium]|nr:translation initiation factor IF-2 [Clostridia bacterium]
MAKVRIHELAKDMGISSRELLDKLVALGLPVKNHMSTIPSQEVERIKNMVNKFEQKDEKEKVKEIKTEEKELNKPKTSKKTKPKFQHHGEENKENGLEKDYDEYAYIEDKDEGKLKKFPKSAKKISDKSPKTFNQKGKGKKSGRKDKGENVKEISEVKRHVVIDGSISVQDLAHQLGKKATEVIKKLMMMGMMVTINQELDPDTAVIVAEEFGATTEIKTSKEEELFAEVEDRPEDLKPRPPVVTIMGHVDHGKTSLLDKIRETNVTATEAGGITQHIGAYQVEIAGQKITFLDTPGHEAFTAMRARGAQVTDIAILVVAADDGVMPQTIEAIHHAQAAKVPIIVAINKIDKPTANPERIKQELTEYGLVPEEWGGETIMVPVSAQTGENIDLLLEMILLVAEMAELKANPNRKARGTVIEAKLDKGRGPVATLLIQNGTLQVSDFLIVGTTQGRIRAMFDYRGRKLKSAGPSTPVEILGLADVPEAGDDFISVEDEKLAKQVAEKRQQEKHEEEIKKRSKVSLDELFSQIQQGEVKELNIILKADVQGSIEALRQSLEKLSTDEVRVNIIHTAVGGIKETDVMLAAASNAIIIGFNVRPDINAKKAAEKENVDIRTYRIIYDAIDDVKKALSGLLAPEIKEVELGHAEVRAIFKVPKVGTIAGSYVTEGKITRSAKIRIVRDGVVIHDGEIASLKRFKDDVREVTAGYECGIGIEKFNDIKEGDILEAYTFEEVKREL